MNTIQILESWLKAEKEIDYLKDVIEEIKRSKMTNDLEEEYKKVLVHNRELRSELASHKKAIEEWCSNYYQLQVEKDYLTQTIDKKNEQCEHLLKLNKELTERLAKFQS